MDASPFSSFPCRRPHQAERKRTEYEAKLTQNQAQLSHEQRELQQLEQVIAEKEARLLHGGQIMDQVRDTRADWFILHYSPSLTIEIVF